MDGIPRSLLGVYMDSRRRPAFVLAVLAFVALPAFGGDAPDAALTALLRRAEAKDTGVRPELLTFIRRHPGTPLHRRAAEALTLLPSPLDRLDAAKIDAARRDRLAVPGLVAVIDAHNRAIASVTFSPDGSKIASSGWDNKVHVSTFGRAEAAAWAALDGSPSGVAFSPDGRLLAAGGAESGVVLWDVAGAKPVLKFTLAGHRRRPFAVAFDPAGKLFVSASHEPVLRLWKLDGDEPEAWGALANEEDAPAIGVASLAFRGDGKLLAAGCLLGKQTLRFWDPSGSYLEEKFFKAARARLVAFAPADPVLAFAGNDAAIHLWKFDGERATGLHVFEGHAAGPLPPAVKALAFAPTGARLASAGIDRKIILWDVATGKKEREWTLPAEPRALAFAPDGRHLAVGNADGTLFILRVSSGKIGR
jgi:WD40 repeat protein